MTSELYIAVVCSCNMNRSMEAHAALLKNGFNVKSYGTGEKVKLPGLSADQPNCYDFGVSYKDIYFDLIGKNESFYTQNGLLQMLIRNGTIKSYPEKFQESTEKFDIIITCEERVYDEVIEWFRSRKPKYNKLVHVLNIDIQDTIEEASIGAFMICEMISKMAQYKNLDKDLIEILPRFEERYQKFILNCVVFY